MTRSLFSRLGAVVVLALSAASTATADALDRAFAGTRFVLRRAVALVDVGLAWLVAKLPKAPRGGMADGRHGAQQTRQVLPPTMWSAVRRPQVSPRWRMCPST